MEQAGHQSSVIPESLLEHSVQCASHLSQSLDGTPSQTGGVRCGGGGGRDLTGALLVGQRAPIETDQAVLPLPAPFSEPGCW